MRRALALPVPGGSGRRPRAAWRGLSESGPREVRSAGLRRSSRPDTTLPRRHLSGYQFSRRFRRRRWRRSPARRMRGPVPGGGGPSERPCPRERGPLSGFTYATGAVQARRSWAAQRRAPALLTSILVFFQDGQRAAQAGNGRRGTACPLLDLEALAGLRPGCSSDKRSQGHLAVVGGSGDFPGPSS